MFHQGNGLCLERVPCLCGVGGVQAREGGKGATCLKIPARI